MKQYVTNFTNLIINKLDKSDKSSSKLQVGQIKHCNWASEASPTLGCSIEISRDIYIYVHVSVVCQINCVGGITYGPRACSKSFFGG